MPEYRQNNEYPEDVDESNKFEHVYEDNCLQSQQYQPKPNISYSSLIAEVIMESKDKKLTLKEIYDSIMRKYPYFQNQKSNWQNSIRHNLSLNKAFFKIPRDSSMGKGSFWGVNVEEYSINGKPKSKKLRRGNFVDTNLLLLQQNEPYSFKNPLEHYSDSIFLQPTSMGSSDSIIKKRFETQDLKKQEVPEEYSYYNEESFYSNDMFRFP